MKTIFSFVLSVSLLVVVGCNEFLPTAVSTDPIHVFDQFWKEYDRRYALFNEKAIDWDSVYSVWRPTVNEQTTDAELQDVFTRMIRGLDDGHVYLHTGDTVIYSDTSNRFSLPNFDVNVVRHSYLIDGGLTAEDERLTYGWLDVEHRVGYIHIQSWEQIGGPFDPTGDWVNTFEQILEEYRNAHSLIIDVRDNSGGSFFNSRRVAGRFAKQDYPVSVQQFRDGPEHDNFTPLETWNIVPEGAWQFAKPVVVLANERSASACEWFVLAMQQIPHVQFIGQTTAGSLGSRIARELPNGWTCGVTVQRLYTASDTMLLESRGMIPDVVVQNTVEELQAGLDRILEAAMEQLM